MLDLTFFADDESACCSSYLSWISSGNLRRPSVGLDMHQEGPGDYAVVVDYKRCDSVDGGTADCAAPFTAAVSYFPATGGSIPGVGTLHVDEGGAFDSRSVAGTIDVGFVGGGSSFRFNGTFKSLRCGTE